ncbi:peroxisome biogenesis protein 5-like [Chenopodium quinoa]|uniref:peroxisome biogenesis protein 5-like n=1 Tax=Chenopodium quinoa TaxID=63459 RepID=UPI000B772F32|nr:peroxisome biogenesis protein 5-like [Chenopodium quinoa]XP_021735518.1 peroxisome biogenesis protein 5-like [Chenopodium quinoa]XP_021735519.1 peroxisome biogenesis protein 5-like [Chenopodium quinoa]
MAMRDLVTGGASCNDSGSSSSSNPLGSLANALIGSSSKTQERLKEIPTSTSSGSSNQFYSNSDEQLTALPGSESEYHFNQHSAGQDVGFLHNYRSASHSGFTEAWDDIQPERESNFLESRHIYNEGFATQTQQSWDGPPQKILSGFLHSFVDSSRFGAPFRPTALPMLGLTKGEKQCIRNRSSIMARHFFADKSEEYINAQVDALLCSLDIDNDIQLKGPLPGRVRELEEYWNESQGVRAPVADGWVAEYRQNKPELFNPNGWANLFEQEHGPNGWASEFEHDQAQAVSLNQSNQHMSRLAGMEQTRILAHTLAQNNDPKFQNSRFLQFVSKMSRGELFVEGNQVKESSISASGDWGAEYQQHHDGGLSWADQFSKELPRGEDKWVNEFTSAREKELLGDDKWVDEFSKLNVQDWVGEFEHQTEGAVGEDIMDSWASAYDEYLNEQSVAKHNSDSSKGVYVFSDMNPYVGHPDPLKEGQELFRKGLLSESVLALEAEVLKNPGNAEGWRLLGIAHAENDDDQQAIASMMRAQEVDPTNLEVLLALGVSHTNELEQSAALKYLYQWLRNHPKYGTLSPEELPDSLYYADIARIFNEAAQISPEDADVHIVLGVLYNLSREYDKAIDSFKTAIKLKPHDYSLWNKLGATQANSVQSAEAIDAYQQALDLKPNYVRAWANMGISYANQGMYEESIRYYVRALAMNPKADNAWQYLRISLSCASRNDMLEACDSRNIDVLQKEFPL